MLAGAERSAAVARTWPDEYIDYWGEVYLDHPAIAARGVIFEYFLAYPVPVLIALRIPCPVALPVPSPQLQRLLSALERNGACRSNGKLIEKLRHTRMKRSRGRQRGADGRLV